MLDSIPAQYSLLVLILVISSVIYGVFFIPKSIINSINIGTNTSLIFIKPCIFLLNTE